MSQPLLAPWSLGSIPYPSVLDEAERSASFWQHPIQLGKLGAYPHALTLCRGRNHGTMRCLFTVRNAGAVKLLPLLSKASSLRGLFCSSVWWKVSARRWTSTKLCHPRVTAKIGALWGKDEQKLLFHHFDVTQSLFTQSLKNVC